MAYSIPSSLKWALQDKLASREAMRKKEMELLDRQQAMQEENSASNRDNAYSAEMRAKALQDRAFADKDKARADAATNSLQDQNILFNASRGLVPIERAYGQLSPEGRAGLGMMVGGGQQQAGALNPKQQADINRDSMAIALKEYAAMRNGEGEGSGAAVGGNAAGQGDGAGFDLAARSAEIAKMMAPQQQQVVDPIKKMMDFDAAREAQRQQQYSNISVGFKNDAGETLDARGAKLEMTPTGMRGKMADGSNSALYFSDNMNQGVDPEYGVSGGITGNQKFGGMDRLENFTKSGYKNSAPVAPAQATTQQVSPEGPRIKPQLNSLISNNQIPVPMASQVSQSQSLQPDTKKKSSLLDNLTWLGGNPSTGSGIMDFGGQSPSNRIPPSAITRRNPRVDLMTDMQQRDDFGNLSKFGLPAGPIPRTGGKLGIMGTGTSTKSYTDLTTANDVRRDPKKRQDWLKLMRLRLRGQQF